MSEPTKFRWQHSPGEPRCECEWPQIWLAFPRECGNCGRLLPADGGIDDLTLVRCTRCGYQGFPDGATILGIGPIWGCPECDAIVALLEVIES